MPLFLGQFARQYPKVELAIEELKTQEIIARLRADTLDAGLAATPLGIPGLSETTLGKEPMFAYLPPGDALAKKREVSQIELKGRTLWVMPEGHCFRSQVLSYCGRDMADSPAGIQFESGSFQTLIRLVDEGLGATVLPELALRDIPESRKKAQVRPLVSPVPVREIGLVTSRADLRRRVTEALEHSIRAALREALSAAPRRAKTLDPLARAE
jgi:LysR family transcriptional regulator, hydrogen peroxide-inducible genes activator